MDSVLAAAVDRVVTVIDLLRDETQPEENQALLREALMSHSATLCRVLRERAALPDDLSRRV